MFEIKLKEKTKKFLIQVLLFCISFLIAVIIPIISYNLSLERKELILYSQVIIGIIISIFILLTYIQKYMSILKLISSLIPGILYILYIIVSLEMNKLVINIQYFYLSLDFSLIYLGILGIPVLVIIRNIYIFLIKRKELKHNFIFLETIKNAKKLNSKKQLKKHIFSNFYLESSERNYILRNFNEILYRLETGDNPLIYKTNQYRLTKNGLEMLLLYEKHNELRLRIPYKYEKIKRTPEQLEVWTEEELLKIARKRKLEKVEN